MNRAHDDATVLRIDPSLSGGGHGRGHGNAPRVLKQRFVLEEKLGSGGMGTVYRAKDLRKVEAQDRNPYVAVKVLNNDFREHPEAFIALQREAAKSQALSHRNIVSIYDFDKDGDVPFIIMELLEGQELADLLRAYPTGLPDEIAWPVIRCLCDGLEHAHEAGLVHADFKPGNVYVAPNHTAKILDFGIARAVRSNQALADDPVFDPSRLAALTPAYASPQMLDGAEPDPRDDVFSLGVVIYLMLTGQHPFGRVPANEAAKQGSKPERPRRLGRRQWRVLERCLAFDRSVRPASVAAVRSSLFQPSPWRSRTAVVAAVAVVVSFVLSGLKEDVAVQEARVEARQTTLLDAQLERLRTLLATPRFDSAWEEDVAKEAAALRALLPAGAPEPAVIGGIRQLYQNAIAAAPDPDRAIALYRRGTGYGPLPQAEAHLEERLGGAVTALLDAPVLDTEWMDALDAALGRLQAVFPKRAVTAALWLETVDVLQAELEASIVAERFPAARRALGFLETYSFAAESLEALQAKVEAAEREYLARQAEAARQAALAELETRLAPALAGPCLDFDPTPAAAVLRAWVGEHPALAQSGRAVLGKHVARCMAQLEALDQSRAQALRQRTQELVGVLPGLGAFREDPCAADYLVGNGAQGGRRGFCSDRLGDAGQGPRLVVIPAKSPGARFAITRQEVSWAELKPFCAETGRCRSQGSDELPVADVPVTLARDYARWLTSKSGFLYRLPTWLEWQQAAQGTSDPNRNCQVQIGGVHRGLAPVAADTGTPNPFGLVNVLGNVQEWVVAGDEIKVAGGAFRDPIAECAVETVRAQSGDADPATGFRLVRELS